MATITWQREGSDFSAPGSAVTGYASNPTNGFLRTAYFEGQWIGENLTYTEGIWYPTGGTLYSYKDFNSTGWEVASFSGLNFQLAGPDSFDPIGAVITTSENRKESIFINGGPGNDVLAWHGSQNVDTYIDGRSGTDTLALSQNYANYSVTEYNASLGTLTLFSNLAGRGVDVKSVESFRFNDQTISFADLSPYYVENLRATFYDTSLTSGPHKVGQQLVSNYSFSDPNGTATSTGTTSWFRYDGINYTNTGVTGDTYTISEQDLGYQIAVQHGFVDDAGFVELSDFYGYWGDVVESSDSGGSESKAGENDTFRGGKSGGSTFDGGFGHDTVAYSLMLSDVDVNAVTTGSSKDGSEYVSHWEVNFADSTDSKGNALISTDILNNIERVEFTDKTLALDVGLGQNAGQTLALLYAGFDAMPNEELLGEWISVIDDLDPRNEEQEADILGVAQSIIDTYAPGISNEVLVSVLYNNVVGTPASPSSVSSFVSQIENGAFTQASLYVMAATSSLNTGQYYEDIKYTGVTYIEPDSKSG